MSNLDDRLTAAWLTVGGWNPLAARKAGELEPRAADSLLVNVSRIALTLGPGDRAALVALLAPPAEAAAAAPEPAPPAPLPAYQLAARRAVKRMQRKVEAPIAASAEPVPVAAIEAPIAPPTPVVALAPPPCGPDYPKSLGAAVDKFRRKSRAGLADLTAAERRDYGNAVGKAIRALQRSELYACLKPAAPCARGDLIGKARANALRGALLACPAQIRRARTDAVWASMYAETMAEKHQAQHAHRR